MKIAIKNSVLIKALNKQLNCDIYSNYDKEVLKEADVPNKLELINQIMADAKFIKRVEKKAEAFMESILNEVLFDNEPAVLNKVINRCEKIEEKISMQKYTKSVREFKTKRKGYGCIW